MKSTFGIATLGLPNFVCVMLAFLAGISMSICLPIGAAMAKGDEVTTQYKTCRLTDKSLKGGLGASTSPDDVCLREFGEGWGFASPRSDVAFILKDLKRKQPGPVGWCNHSINNCAGWTLSNRASDATVCTIARRPTNNTGILGMRSRELCDQSYPIWCCREESKGESQ
jgi:hypothetical protein